MASFTDDLELSNDLPVLTTGRDTMRQGLGTIQNDKLPVHPVQIIQDTHFRRENESRKMMLNRVFGVYFPMRLQIEETILSQFQRFPGLKSSFVGLETLLGMDEEIEFEDYLSNPEYDTKMIDVFAEMEKRVGDQPVKTPQ